MQVFKTFMKIAKRKLPIVLMYAWIFIVLLIMFTAYGPQDVSFEEESLGVCVIDEDNTDASLAITDYISKSHKLIEIENDKDEIIDALYYTRVDYVLVIKEGYSEKIANGQTDNLFENYQLPDSYAGVYLENDIDLYIRTLNSYIAAGNDAETAASLTAEALDYDIDVTIETFSDETEGTSMNQATYYYFRYLVYILLSVLITMLSGILITILRKEVRDGSNCSGMPSLSQTMQIIAGCIVLVLILWVVFMIIAMIYKGGIFSANELYAVLNSFVFTLIATSIAILVAALVSNNSVINLVSNIISLGMSFLCGVFVDQALLGGTVLRIAKFLPAYWYVRANDIIAGKSEIAFDAGEVMSCIGIQAIFAVALFAVVILVFRTKQTAK
ncbi:MAG: ABC transporter permease [Oscillospiraceae bacterium]|nr:ABC transporter permease [Oscillospiraceae bacterium]